ERGRDQGCVAADARLPAPQSPVMIVVERLTKTFRVAERRPGAWNALAGFVRRRYRPLNAIKDISFSLAEGELLGLIGPNGAGKSTTIKIFCGFFEPSSGRCDVGGMVLWVNL